MDVWTCVIIGGGHVGLAALKAIKAETQGTANGRQIRFVLIDRQPGHVRKMLMFRPAAGEEDITVPFTHYGFTEGVEVVQGSVSFVNRDEQKVRYQDRHGNDTQIHYDLLVVAVGSVVRQPDPNQGGISLNDIHAAQAIREHWRANLRQAVDETDPMERKRLMTVAVAGAGISGVETSAELAPTRKTPFRKFSLSPSKFILNAWPNPKHICAKW